MPNGVLVINKPMGPTSHDVVNQVRRSWPGKVGHTGTLDPQATGVLPLMLGRATRLMRFFSHSDKVYDAQIRLGQTTDTYDAQGQITAEGVVPDQSRKQCLQLLREFEGTIQQLPPMYSAVRVAGRRLYKEARAGREVQRTPREVTFYSIQLLQQQPNCWNLRVHCSSGTYLRTLAHDIGRGLGCGAHLEGLTRLSSGQFELEQAVSPTDSTDSWLQKMIPLEELLPDLPRLDLTQEEVNRITHGNPVLFNRGKPLHYRLFHQGSFYAIGRMEKGFLQPFVVLRTELVSGSS